MKLNIAVFSTAFAVTEAIVDFQSGVNRLKLARELNEKRKALGRPWQILMSVKDGTFVDGIESIDPKLTWEDSFDVGDVEVEYGVEATINVGDNASRTAWARVMPEKQSGWGVSLRGDIDVKDLADGVGLEFDVDNEETNFSFGADATVKGVVGNSKASPSIEFGKVEGSYTTDTDILDQPGTFSLTPRYDFSTDYKDVLLSYKSGKTQLEIKVTGDNKELKASRRLAHDNTIGIVVDTQSKGLPEIDYERDLPDGGTLNINYKNEKAAVNWEDGKGWVAKGTVDVDSSGLHNANVRIGTNLKF